MLKELEGRNKVQCGALHNNWIIELGKIQFTELYYLFNCYLLGKRNYLQE